VPNIVQIDDADDPQVEAYARIRERDLVGHERRFIAEGELVLRILVAQRHYEIESVFLLDARLDRVAPLLGELPDGVPVYSAPRAVMDRIVGFPIHRGVLAMGRRGPDVPSRELLSGLTRRALVVGLIGVSNHDNVGGIFRNAAAFGADAVLLDSGSCDPLYRKAIRVSAGASLLVPFVRGGDAEDMLADLEQAGCEVISLTPGGRETLEEVAWSARTALLFGAEGPGLPPAILSRTRTVRVPMAAGFDSLNVATASGIALYEAMTR
jgi:tRNA G18 (ribose-2'-O)-methylase SpoU